MFIRLLNLKKIIMKNVKKLLVVTLIALFAIPMLNSCKKGDGDPALSLKSRAGRLKGEWNLASGTEMGTWGGTPYTITYTGSMATIMMSGQTDSWMYTEKNEFLKDNVFKSTVMEDGDLTTIEGFWAFMDGYGDIANKECVVIRVKQATTTNGVTMFTGDDMPVWVFRLNKLSGSEMIVEEKGTTMSGGSSQTDITKTYTKK